MAWSAWDRFGRRVAFTYNAGNELQSITDSQNRSTQFSYRPDGLLDRITDSAGRVHQYAYATVVGATRPTTYTDPGGGITRFEYQADGLLSRILTPENRETRISYYPAGDPNAYKVKSVQRVTGTHLGCTGNWIGSICFGTTYTIYDGPTRGYEYNSGYATSTGTVTHPIGTSTPSGTDHRTTYEFDKTMRAKKATDALSQHRESGYDSFGNVDELTPSGATQLATAFTYGNGTSEPNRLTRVDRPTGGGDTLSTTLSYPTVSPGPADFLPTEVTDAQDNKTTSAYDQAAGNSLQLLSSKVTKRGSPSTIVSQVQFAYSAPRGDRARRPPPLRQRQLILMRAMGVKYAEIARATGDTKRTVERQHAYATLRRLRAKLE